jgi:replicative DNA helicase
MRSLPTLPSVHAIEHPSGDNSPSRRVEGALLAGLLLRPSYFATVSAILHPEDFTTAAHRTLFSVLRSMHQQDQLIDSVTVIDALSVRGLLSIVGGEAFVLGLTDTIPLFEHLVHYARRIHARAQKRAFAREFDELARAAQHDASFDTLLARTNELVAKLAEMVQSQPLRT